MPPTITQSMDWLQFFSIVITAITGMLGAWAWPAVVAFLIYLLRSQLIFLAQRLENVSFPGGGAATFRAGLENAKSRTIELVAKSSELVARSSGSTITTGDISAPNNVPGSSAAEIIRNSFEEAEELVRAYTNDLPLSVRRMPADFIFHELSARTRRTEVYELYNQLRELHLNAAISPPESITIEDANQYKELCDIFQNMFVAAFNIWKGIRATSPGT